VVWLWSGHWLAGAPQPSYRALHRPLAREGAWDMCTPASCICPEGCNCLQEAEYPFCHDSQQCLVTVSDHVSLCVVVICLRLMHQSAMCATVHEPYQNSSGAQDDVLLASCAQVMLKMFCLRVVHRPGSRWCACVYCTQVMGPVRGLRTIYLSDPVLA
jgi:hypothetical protein